MSDNKLFLPSLKKFPGKTFSFKLLYDKSKTSRTGNAPKPLKPQANIRQCQQQVKIFMTHRGSELRRLIEQLRILSFGIDERDSGNSSRWLLDKFRISKFTKFAICGGNTKNERNYEFSLFRQISRRDSPEILLWLKVRRVQKLKVTETNPNARILNQFARTTKICKQMGVNILFLIWTSLRSFNHSQMVGISSNEWRFLSTKSISRVWNSRASSIIFLTFDMFFPETGKHCWDIFSFREATRLTSMSMRRLINLTSKQRWDAYEKENPLKILSNWGSQKLN